MDHIDDLPNEPDDAGTTRVEVVFPEQHPIASVSVKDQPGWTYTVERGAPAVPLEAHGEAVTEVVKRIAWEGGPIDPGEFAEFEVSAGPLPADTEALVFPALQTYSSGEVVRWIEEPTTGGEEPEFPAPVLELIAADGDGGSQTAGENEAGTHPDAAAGAEPADVDGQQPASTRTNGGASNALAVTGIVLGALGLLAGGISLVRTSRRPTGTS